MSELSFRDRELVALGAALASNCEPCVEYHVAEAQKAGLTGGEIAAAIAPPGARAQGAGHRAAPDGRQRGRAAGSGRLLRATGRRRDGRLQPAGRGQVFLLLGQRFLRHRDVLPRGHCDDRDPTDPA